MDIVKRIQNLLKCRSLKNKKTAKKDERKAEMTPEDLPKKGSKPANREYLVVENVEEENKKMEVRSGH